jgi:predicted lipid-binding transport protein (Tim44 family)
MTAMTISGNWRHQSRLKLLRLFIFFSVLLLTLSGWARGGGGCLEAGTLIATPDGEVPIEHLQRGDPVWSVVNGHRERATVQASSQVDPSEYVELSVAGKTLRATSEHPLQTGPGIFRTAESLHAGNQLAIADGDIIRLIPIDAVARVKPAHPAYNLLVLPGGTYIANGFVVHNKGCFLPETPVLRADGTASPISEIQPGDQLTAFTTSGEIVQTTVRNIITHEVDEYLVVTTEQTTLQVTKEHPFYVGQGTFKTLAALQVGDQIYGLEDGQLAPQRILSLVVVPAPTRVYNLQTDQPNTYFASGVAVHNKGGGCFPDGTLVSTPRGGIPIETLQTGDAVLAVDARGDTIETSIENVHRTRSALLRFETDRGMLRTTREHPLLSRAGEFHLAGELKAGDEIMAWRNGRLMPATIQQITATDQEVVVYNLQVGEPHTFVADGFVVHNKGGGGGGFHGGGYHGGSGGGTLDPTTFFIIFGLIVGVCLILSLSGRFESDGSTDEDLDYVYARSAITPKAAKTKKLLEFLARVDETMAPEKLVEQAKSTFIELQKCWQSRAYQPMQSLLMPDLYAEHCSQLSGLIANHELNIISDLRVEQVDIVNVRYGQKKHEQEYTALITATARDYYVEDRTRGFLRGDEQPARFQEFWTFQRQDGAWRLREIEQSRESDALKDENFFEQFTDTGLNQVYDDTANQAGPAGPWLDKATETKATRTERLLNFLVQTDKLWNRQAMLERARKVFLDVTLAREKGDPGSIPTDEMFPGIAAGLQGELIQLGANGTRLEFRNLCVRKVELIFVQNYSDNSQDEFTVRISAHAQRAVQRNNLLISRDAYVTPFVEFWTFGRLDNDWKLKEVVPAARGNDIIGAENVDEGSSPGQLEWFYKQTRAV